MPHSWVMPWKNSSRKVLILQWTHSLHYALNKVQTVAKLPTIRHQYICAEYNTAKAFSQHTACVCSRNLI